MALFVPSGRPDPWAHRRGEPRTFAVLWLFFVLGCLAVTIGGVGVLGMLHPDVYRPAARALLAVVAVGVSVVWPMVRLSQDYPTRALRSAFVDLLVVTPPALLLVWPQCLPWMAGWPIEAALAISLSYSGWAVLVAGLLGLLYTLAAQGAAPARWAGMLVFLTIALAGPALASSVAPPTPGDSNPWLLTSPITSIFELARDRSWSGRAILTLESHWTAGWLVLAVGLMTWGLALVVQSSPGRAAGGAPASAGSPE